MEGKKRKRVWIDSQTEEEILRGIREAKDLSEYDNLSASAYLRAKEDYLMGINFSRLLTLKYGNSISNYLRTKYAVISVGRVMTCVLGMIVRREREIRDFVKTPFYRVLSTIEAEGQNFEGEWRAVKGSRFFESFDLYKENGFKKREKAEELVALPEGTGTRDMRRLRAIEKKKEKKRIRRCYIIWRSFRMTAPNGSRSARMRRSGSYRSCMRRSWLLIRERTPGCCPQPWQRRSAGI